MQEKLKKLSLTFWFFYWTIAAVRWLAVGHLIIRFTEPFKANAFGLGILAATVVGVFLTTARGIEAIQQVRVGLAPTHYLYRNCYNFDRCSEDVQRLWYGEDKLPKPGYMLLFNTVLEGVSYGISYGILWALTFL